MNDALLEVRRVRHETRMRRATVRRVTQLSPHVVAVTFHSPDFVGFSSDGFDDHVKLVVPAHGEAEPALPTQGPVGIRVHAT